MNSNFENLAELSVHQLRAGFANKVYSRGEVLAETLTRIRDLDEAGPMLHAVIAHLAEQDLRALEKSYDGPLGGIPILVKDNMDTKDFPTTAGSLALEGSTPRNNATVVDALVQLGATIVGKTNLSEWSNFRGLNSSSGWSGLGGQSRNPYVLDRSPGGSSSGSAIAVAAGYVPVALGTETDGSIICPAAVNGVVGFKPTHGVIPTTGVIPISSSQDTVGLFARSVSDVAFIFGELVKQLGIPKFYGDNFASTFGAYRHSTSIVKIGIPRMGNFGYSVKLDRVFEEAVAAIAQAGIVFEDSIDAKTESDFSFGIDDEILVFRWEMYQELNRYLKDRGVEGASSIEDLIVFNRTNYQLELQHFGQEHFEAACGLSFRDVERYEVAQRSNRRRAETAILRSLTVGDVDLMCVPSMSPAWLIDQINGDSVAGSGYSIAAVAGVCSINIPIGLIDGLPVGMTLFGSYHDDAKLLGVASKIESILQFRALPKFLATLGVDN